MDKQTKGVDKKQRKEANKYTNIQTHKETKTLLRCEEPWSSG